MANVITSNVNIDAVKDVKGSMGLTIYPRELKIVWGDDQRYWTWFWILLESQDYKIVEIPKLLDVCWLQIEGSCEISTLTAGVTYEVVFVVMMKEPLKGWETSPVTLKLELPDGDSQSHDTNLSKVPTNEWQMISVGTFKATGGTGNVKFSMMETKQNNWKTGLIIKNVLVRPVY